MSSGRVQIYRACTTTSKSPPLSTDSNRRRAHSVLRFASGVASSVPIFRLRQECPSTHWFLTLAAAREKMEAWRRFCDADRPRGAIGREVPIALTEPGGEAGPPP